METENQKKSISTKKQKDRKDLVLMRPPVVVILGHVDSGKTSILDFIRKANVVSKESGGITQHIGAYQIEKDDKKITFIDTPGHEAFSAMRGRGAKVADIAILVVDSTAGIQPQTKEAISHIKEAKIPFIVAFNKVDRQEADPEKIKRELSKEDVLVESIGGKIPSQNISAKTGQGISDLLELILLVGEMENLKTDLSKTTEGAIIESHLDSKRGPIAMVILSEGILKIGDILGTASAFGKIKSLENFQGAMIEKASPGEPAVVIGFNDVPKLGESFKVFPDIEQAEKNINIVAKKEAGKVLEIKEDQKVLKLILKTDFQGSIEAIEEVLERIPQEKVVLNILKSGVGDINESDIKLAKSGQALILGFRVKLNPVAKQITEKENIKAMTFEVVYDLVEGVRKFMEKILTPELARVDLGQMKVLAVFWAEKNRQIIGGRVSNGEVRKGSLIEVFRNEELLGRGKMINLQRNKKDTERVPRGEECGILYEGDIKIEVGDILTIYTEERQKSKL